MSKPVRFIKGVGEAREKLMTKLGVRLLGDLIGFFPRAYEDRTNFKEISSLIVGETVCVSAVAATPPAFSGLQRGQDVIKLLVKDGSGSMDVTFFNRKYLKDTIKQGDSYVLYGKVAGTQRRPAMVNPLIEKEANAGEISGKIMPVYALTAGLTQRTMRNSVRFGLNECGEVVPDALPDSVTEKYKLCKTGFAYENIHFPADFQALDIARNRLIFEELFVVCAAMKLMRSKRVEKTARKLDLPDIGEFIEKLPFRPTGAQVRAIAEAAEDMTRGVAMNRLVQGDVGSGKTLVAAACCWLVWRAGLQSAFMAPTEILAKQHFNTLTAMLKPFGMRVGLLTGSMTEKKKKAVCDSLELGEIDLITGTHALISQRVQFRDLALVVTDEQHRFGVNQRSTLAGKGESPHVMVMSATPIPRTLALIIYGDLDVSVLDEMPPGRQAVDTYVVGEKHRKRIYAFIEKLVSEGRQAYIVCPMVEESEQAGSQLKSAREYYETVSKEALHGLRAELVHGKMAARDKDKVMAAFAEGKVDVLVATTVVEVGVDVPNAALMIVENADRFGLSQLHQLRGRVGRGEHKSYCILFRSESAPIGAQEPSEGSYEEIAARLKIMSSTNDGFKIAEEDLKLRGPGDFFGSRQHGLPDLKIANLATDMLILNRAQSAASEVLSADPGLAAPENRKLARRIKEMFETNSDKMN